MATPALHDIKPGVIHDYQPALGHIEGNLSSTIF